MNEDLKLEDVWSTKEKWVIFTVPMWAIACETIQQKVVLGYIQIEETLIIVLSAMLIFVLALGYGYLKKL